MAVSREEAIRLNCRLVAPEHLLLAMLRVKPGVVDVLENTLNVNTEEMRHVLEERISKYKSNEILANEADVELDEHATSILKLSVLEARMQSSPVVDEEHLLLAMLHDKRDNGAKIILEQNKINYDEMKNFFFKKDKMSPQNGLGIPDEEDEDDFIGGKNYKSAGSSVQTEKAQSKTPMVDNFGTDLTKAAAEGKLDPVVGREKEIERVVEILCRRKKNNPILIGEPGVGKSAIVEGLAIQIANKTTSPVLYGKGL